MKADGWLLIVTDNAKVKEASIKFILQIAKLIYSATNTQIPLDTRFLAYPVPEIEGKAQTMTRATNTIIVVSQQASAWGPVFADNDTSKGGSRMRNLHSQKPRRVRKIAELYFDPESTAEFPHLQTEKTEKATMKYVTSKAKSDTPPPTARSVE